MIGTAKLSEMREQVRKSFKKSDAQLLAWFNEQIKARAAASKKPKGELDGLKLLRDALKLETAKRKTPSRKPTRNRV